MFEVKKGKSANTEAEYIIVDLNEIKEHIEDIEPYQIVDKTFNKKIFYDYKFEISPKAYIVVRKLVTRKKKNIRGINIIFYHIAYRNNDGDVYWPTGVECNKDLRIKKSFNANLTTGLGTFFNKTRFYIAFDEGFCAQNMYKNPHFLSEEAFDYIYKSE